MTKNNIDTAPIEIEDERVGKHFEHVRDGTTFFCTKCVLYNGYKFLKFNLIDNDKDGCVTTMSWCLDNDISEANFWMNYMEM